MRTQEGSTVWLPSEYVSGRWGQVVWWRVKVKIHSSPLKSMKFDFWSCYWCRADLQGACSLESPRHQANSGSVCVLNPVRLFETPWTVACQDPLSMEFCKQEYWSRLPCPPPWDLPDPGIKLGSPALQMDSLPAELPGKPQQRLWVQFSSVTQSCLTLCDPMDCSTPGLPVHHKLPEFTQTQVHWISDAIQPSHCLWSPSPPTINLSQHQGLFKESVLCIRWPQYWSFSFSPSSEYSGLISFRMDWLDLLVVQGTPKSLPQHHSSKILRCSAFFILQISHPYRTTWKIITWTRWTFVGKVMSFNAFEYTI